MTQYPGADSGQPVAAGSGSASDAQAKKSSMLGIVGLVMVVVDLIVIIVVRVISAGIVVSLGSSTMDSTGMLDAEVFNGLGVVLLVMASGVMGLAGWIVGIVATVTNRGRVWGVVAIILGVVTFLVASTLVFGTLLTTVG